MEVAPSTHISYGDSQGFVPLQKALDQAQTSPQPQATPVPEVIQAPTAPLAPPRQIIWPEPEYTADGRLAPELPEFTYPSPYWDRNVGPMGNQRFNKNRRPPPVTPKDIYRLASAQDATSAGMDSHYQQEDASQRNSANRFQQRVDEVWTEPQLQPQSIPIRAPVRSEPKQDALQQMLNAPANSFSIQWTVSTDPAAIKRLQQRYPLLNQATVVRFKSLGEVWYLLLSGIYPDSASARSMLNSHEYQAMVRHLKPWMRPLAGLKSLRLVAENGEPIRSSVQQSQGNRQTVKQPVLPQGAYTIEWMASDNHRQLQQMRNRYVQLADAEIVMVARRQGMRYFLIQGRFSGFKAVENARLSPQFSSLAHHFSPKPRPMASLRHQTRLLSQGTPAQSVNPMATQSTLPKGVVDVSVRENEDSYRFYDDMGY